MNSCCSGLTGAYVKQINSKVETVQLHAHCQSRQAPPPSLPHSINLFDCWATSAAWRGATITALRHATTATCSLVDFHHDWVDDTLDLLLLSLELVFLGKLILVQPIQTLLNRLLNLVFVITLKFVLQFLLLQCVAHCEAVVLQTVLGLNFAFVLFILFAVLLCLIHHTVNLRLRQTPLLICDGDLVGLACGFVLCRHIEDAICIDVEGHLDLRNSTWCRWDAIKVKFAQQVVILGHGTLSLEDLDQHTRLIVRIGSESLAFLGRDRGVTLNELGHDTPCCLQTHGQGCYVQQQQVLHLRRSLASEDCSLHCGAERHCFIRVD